MSRDGIGQISRTMVLHMVMEIQISILLVYRGVSIMHQHQSMTGIDILSFYTHTVLVLVRHSDKGFLSPSLFMRIVE